MSFPVSRIPLGPNNTTKSPFGLWHAAVQGPTARNVYLQSENYSFTPDDGWTSELTFSGPQNVLAAWTKKTIANYKKQDYRVTCDISDQGNGFATLTLRVPPKLGDETEYDDVDTVQWSLNGNDMEKDILTHPSLTVLTDAEWDVLRNYKADPSGTFPTALTLQLVGRDIAALIRRGVQTHSVSQWVLVRSSVLMSEQATQTQIDNVGMQFTKAQMETDEDLPTSLKFALPATGVWIKRTPSISLEKTRYTVNGEYWHADYASTVLFPAAP